MSHVLSHRCVLSLSLSHLSFPLYACMCVYVCMCARMCACIHVHVCMLWYISTCKQVHLRILVLHAANPTLYVVVLQHD